MNDKKKNIGASVRQRLRNRATSDKRPFAELLQYFAMERFLYRLTQSPHGERFILKGALMLQAWQSPETRPTMDIDMLGITSNDVESICGQVADVLAVEIEDGLVFDPSTIRGEVIKEDADYEGVRVRFLGTLDGARVPMQIDVAFGDVVHPDPTLTELPALLDQPAPRLLCYSRESAIAEKLEAMIKLGTLNSRMKDFYDIWLLSRQFEFDGAALAEAIRLTLENRGTALPDVITAFSEDFVDEKAGQWAAFNKRLGQNHLPADFTEVVLGIRDFLQPPLSALASGEPFGGRWVVTDRWIDR
ncbi:MAG: nucleotidyl transferase AbiEii/AbiGii toxin family protein [Sedimenticola sp.]